MGLNDIKTKCGKLAYVKKIIYDLGTGVVRRGDSAYDMFVDLVGDKKYTNIDYFTIVPNRRNYSSLETQVHLLDGTIDVFSWNKCALGRVDTDHKKLRDIMRSAIVSDILSFKRDAVCCSLCCKTEFLQVDHIYPFRDLANSFISLHGSETNPEWIIHWVMYHKQNATLQILCSGCNYKKH